MTIKSGSAADAADIEKNIVTSLEAINHLTVISEDATVTDKTYTWAESELITDATGLNNHIDTGNTTAEYVGDRYICPQGTIYDNFNDDSLDTNLWTKTENVSGGTATVAETNNELQITSVSGTGGSNYGEAFVDSDTNFTGYLKWTASDLLIVDTTSSEYAIASVKIGGTIIVDDGGSPTYGDYANGTWILVRTAVDTYNLYLNGAFKRTISSALSGAVQFYTKAFRSSTTERTARQYVDNVYFQMATSGYVQTSAKTFSANVDSALVYAYKDITQAGTSVDVDISSDGGSVFEKEDQALNTIHALDGDDTDIVLRINLKLTDTDLTPWIYGYAYQGWS